MHETLHGMSASPGIAMGPAHLLLWEVPEVPHRVIGDDDIPVEVERLRAAFAKASDRLRHVRERVAQKAGPEEAEIFDVQISILEDPDLVKQVEDLIAKNLTAEKAFDVVMIEWRHHFSRHSMPMMRERVGDLTDVQIRVLSILLGLPDHDPVDVPEGAKVVLFTHDLTPSLTVQLDRGSIVGLATDAGTRTSHVAILARSLGLPAVVGLRDATARVKGGEQVVLDGSTGEVVVLPSGDEIAQFQRRSAREQEVEAELLLLAEAEPITLDGVRITLRANVDLPEDAERAANSGAEGVGLMRTEFLVVGRANMPDEEEQYRAYRRVVEAFRGKPVVIRTFDIGGDKLPVGGFPQEPNPFLGWRAIRMCLDQPELFKVQLRALLRAGVHGDVRIMLPLVVTVDEVRQTRALIDQAAEELQGEGVPFRRDLQLGVMIETPAAVISADSFVRDARFFSIGTNDLVQYALAVDRGNANIASRFTPLHPAVLRLIQQTVAVGRAHGLEVAVCGEMASQPLMAFALVGLGLRNLSVSPRSVPAMKRIIRGVSAGAAEEGAKAAMAAETAAAAEEELRRRLLAIFPAAFSLGDGAG